jgi:hypothetical protein
VAARFIAPGIVGLSKLVFIAAGFIPQGETGWPNNERVSRMNRAATLEKGKK